MHITGDHVTTMLEAGVIDADTADRIRRWLSERGGTETAGVPPSFVEDHAHRATVEEPARLDLAHAAYYLGGAVILFALGWFAVEAWERFGGWWLMLVSLGYAAAFIGLGERLWQRGLQVPGGLLFTAAAAMAPTFLFALQAGLGIWPGLVPGSEFARLNGHLMVLDLGTVLALLVVMRVRPLPFHAAALALAMIVAAVHLEPAIGTLPGLDPSHPQLIGAMGLLLAGAGYLADRRTRVEYSFWLYVIGMVCFWWVFTDHQRTHWLYPVGNVILVAAALLIQRRVFMVLGALGLFLYMMHLAGEVFRESLLFPVALSVIGLTFILGGVWYNRRQDALRAWLSARLPRGMVAVLPQNR